MATLKIVVWNQSESRIFKRNNFPFPLSFPLRNFILYLKSCMNILCICCRAWKIITEQLYFINGIGKSAKIAFFSPWVQERAEPVANSWWEPFRYRGSFIRSFFPFISVFLPNDHVNSNNEDMKWDMSWAMMALSDRVSSLDRINALTPISAAWSSLC